MKVKLDENLPASLVDLLSRLGHDADSSIDEGLGGADDQSICSAAQSEGRFFVTQDLDFSDLRKFRPGHHHGLLLLRLYHPSREQLENRIVDLFRSESVKDWARCFVVATESKTRVKRPL